MFEALPDFLPELGKEQKPEVLSYLPHLHFCGWTVTRSCGSDVLTREYPSKYVITDADPGDMFVHRNIGKYVPNPGQLADPRPYSQFRRRSRICSERV